MSLHALDALDDALTATRRYRPRGLLEWVWLALVAGAAASPGIGLPTGGGGGGTGGGGGMGPQERAALQEALPASAPDLLLYAVAAVVVLWLLFVVVGSLLEFPFLRWLRDGDRAVRAEVGRHWRRALGLAAFRVVLSLASLAAFAGLVVGLVGPGADPVEYFVALGERWALVALAGLLLGVVGAFTTAFVVPAMWLHGHGVVGGWRRVWPTLTGAPKQFLAYAVGVAVLAAVGGILVTLAAVLALIPALVLALVAAAVAGGPAGIATGALLGGVLATVAVAAVYALLQTFLRFYALLVLGAVDPELDAMPERRRELRDDGGAGGGDEGGEGSGDGPAPDASPQ